MDVAGILDQLRLEREQIEEAILSLERLASGQEKRRGRPPKWMAEAKKRARAQAKKMEPPGRTAAA